MDNHFECWALAQNYNVNQLRKLAHNAELEESVAVNLDTPDAGFWQQMKQLYQAAVRFRSYEDAVSQARRARSKLLKKKESIDYQDIKDRVDIVDFIGRYVTLKKKGNHHEGLCPFHADKNPSLIVWPDIKGFRCMACGAKGDVITFQRMLGERGLR